MLESQRCGYGWRGGHAGHLVDYLHWEAHESQVCCLVEQDITEMKFSSRCKMLLISREENFCNRYLLYLLTEYEERTISKDARRIRAYLAE